MNRSMKTIALSLGLALTATLASAAAAATTMANGRSIYGVPVTGAQGAKLVDTRTAKAINVNCGDIVSFRNGGKSFGWKFDVVGHQAIDLQAIAPRGFDSQPIKVYVARNEAESN